MQEISVAVRALARRPAFALPVVLVLALGIGATTGAFRLTAALLFSEPPVESPGELAWVIEAGDLDDSLSLPEGRDYGERSGAFTGAAMYQSLYADLGRGENLQRIPLEVVTGDFFQVLGVAPGAGRLLLPGDDGLPGSGSTAVISDGLARRLWGEPENALGREIVLNLRPFQVVGVAPPVFRGMSYDVAADVWVPLSASSTVVPWFETGADARQRGHRWLRMVGRLAPRVSLKTAQQRVDAVTGWLAETYPETQDAEDERRLFPVAKGHPVVRSESLPRLALILVTAAIILLVAGTNAANLLLARALARRHELGVRRAVGANRRHLTTHLLAEGAVLFAAGGILGFLLSAWMGPLLAPVLPPGVDAAAFREPDLAVATFALAAILGTTALFAFLPAVLSTGRRSLPLLPLRDAAPVARTPRQRSQGALVVAQVALSALLLVATALLLRTIVASHQVDLGMDVNGVAIAHLAPGRQGWDAARGSAFYRQLANALEDDPRVTAATLVAPTPLAGSWIRSTVEPEGYAPAPDEDMNVHVTVASPGIFSTLAIPLLAGRPWQPGAASDREAVINRALAHRFWGNDAAAVGRRLTVGSDQELLIVGIVADSHYLHPQREPEPRLYRTLAGARHESSMAVLARGRGREGAAEAALDAVRDAVAGIAPEMPVRSPGALSEAITRLLAPQRSLALLLALFAGVTLGVAAIGLYGALAFAVRRRHREIGIRMALGAGTATVVRQVVARGLGLALAGTALGLATAAVTARFLESQLFGVGTTDPVSYIVVAAIVIAVALASSLAPAGRATHVDPIQVLRRS